jgi:hypothetical protein
MAKTNRDDQVASARWLTLEDEKRLQIQLSELDLIPPTVHIFSPPYRCYKLNNQWAKIVMGLVAFLADTHVWAQAENEGYFAIDYINKFMVGDNCPEGLEMTIFRQNPIDTCQLEQSIDGGLTWSLAFDYGLCLGTILSGTQFPNQLELNAILDGLQDDFDTGGIAGINPDTPTSNYNGTGTSDEDNALCLAIDVYVRSYLSNWMDKASQTLGLNLIISTILKVFPPIGLLASELLNSLGFIDSMHVDAVKQQTAIDDVICCMQTALIDSAVNLSNFEQSLDACAFGAGTSEEKVREIVAADLDDARNWYSFLDALGIAQSIIASGAQYNCPCENVWEEEFVIASFPSDLPENWHFIPDEVGEIYVAGTAGIFELSCCVEGTNTEWDVVGFPTNTGRRIIAMDIDFATADINRIEFEYGLTKGTWSNEAEPRFRFIVEGQPTLSLLNSQLINTSNSTVVVDGDYATCSRIRIIMISSATNPPAYSGEVILHSVKIFGRGFNPFA